MIQRWTGTVQEFNGTTVFARLRDETDPSNPEEFAEIPLEKMYGHQRRIRRHIKPGAKFTWTIRIKYVKRGVKGRKEVATSEFCFPYVGRWKRWEIHKIHREATKLWVLLTPGAGVSPPEVKPASEDQTCNSISGVPTPAAARTWRFEQDCRRLGLPWYGFPGYRTRGVL